MPCRSLRGRDLLSMADLSGDEIVALLEVAKGFKVEGRFGRLDRPLEGRNLGLVFVYESTRTRTGFEAAMAQLGGHAIYMPTERLMVARGEPLKDVARVLDRIVDGVAVRLFKHEEALEFADYCSIPVINASTPKDHPTQALGELLTVWERKGRLDGLKLAYVGMTRALCHALLLACPKVGMDFSVAYPEVYQIDEEILAEARRCASETGASITLTHNLKEALEGADVVYACILIRSKLAGEEISGEDKIIIDRFQVNEETMKYAKDDAIFMHPGPIFRGFEVTDGVVEGPQSVVWDEVENAFYAKKAVLASILA